MSNPPSNTDDVIDSKDVIERIADLDAERAALVVELESASAEGGEGEAAAREDLDDWDIDNGEELAALRALAKEGESYAPDWQYGETLIRESYFTDYCEELLKDIGDLPRDLPGYLVIDWEATANNIRIDYTEVDFDGVTYLFR